MMGENLAKVTQASGYACVFVYWAQRFISQMNSFFFFYCDGSNHEYPPGNKLCEGSLAKWAINIGHTPHFNILVWNIGAKKPRKHFQKRSRNPKQQASAGIPNNRLPVLSHCHHPGHEQKTLQQSHGLISSLQDEQTCVNKYFFIRWERRQGEHQDPHQSRCHESKSQSVLRKPFCTDGTRYERGQAGSQASRHELISNRWRCWTAQLLRLLPNLQIWTSTVHRVRNFSFGIGL